MAWPEKLKLSKRLVQSITASGMVSPKEIQLKTLARIHGGQDVLAIGPEGCGKTTTYILAVLNRLKHSTEGVPKVLILVPSKEQVIEVVERFEALSTNKSLLLVGLYAAPGIESQMNALADGADVVVATPDRARAIYLKLGLNLNKIELLIVDDADRIVKQGWQLPVTELANSITRCQHLVFTEVEHERLHKMIAPFLPFPSRVEVSDELPEPLPLLPQLLYLVPNFGTKVNLLTLFVRDEELFTKTVVFVNTRTTAETLYRHLQERGKVTVAVLHPWLYDLQGVSSLKDFEESAELRVLLVAENEQTDTDWSGLPFIIHFDLPEQPEEFIERMPVAETDEENETVSIVFSTDLELNLVRKIERTSGKKMQVAELPAELLIEKDRKTADKKAAKSKIEPPSSGEAFHEKKASNSKTYNYGAGKKAKMTNKKKH